MANNPHFRRRESEKLTYSVAGVVKVLQTTQGSFIAGLVFITSTIGMIGTEVLKKILADDDQAMLIMCLVCLATMGIGLARRPQILAYLTERRMDKFKKRMEARKLSDKVQKQQ